MQQLHVDVARSCIVTEWKSLLNVEEQARGAVCTWNALLETLCAMLRRGLL